MPVEPNATPASPSQHPVHPLQALMQAFLAAAAAQSAPPQQPQQPYGPPPPPALQQSREANGSDQPQPFTAFFQFEVNSGEDRQRQQEQQSSPQQQNERQDQQQQQQQQSPPQQQPSPPESPAPQNGPEQRPRPIFVFHMSTPIIQVVGGNQPQQQGPSLSTLFFLDTLPLFFPFPTTQQPHLQGQPPASAKSLKTRLQTQKMTPARLANNSSCTICLDAFSLSEDATYMPCRHAFHRECIETWLGNSNTCPTCRYELETENEEYNCGVRERMKGRVPVFADEVDVDGEGGLKGADAVAADSVVSVTVDTGADQAQASQDSGTDTVVADGLSVD
ncbi:hypothetical protein HK104_007456 [Borealophlyctis nickersoniae]|nr:hypothetical protein HK104_007456 [Borealophlyctis nickersoniae]